MQQRSDQFQLRKRTLTYYGSSEGFFDHNYYSEPIVREYKAGDDHAAELEALNESGTYWREVGPDEKAVTAAFDTSTNKARKTIPLPLAAVTLGNSNIGAQKAEMLGKHGDFLCTDTVGWELEGSYEPGGDFTVIYDPQATVDSVPDSYFGYFSKEDMIAGLTKKLGSLDKVKIEFSGGQWRLFDSKGKNFTQGMYTESESHKGFIVMQPNDGSVWEKSGNEYILIDGGKIYYPEALRIG